MNELLGAASEVQRFITGRGWSFCFIGGLALQRWGEVRFTRDVDLTLLTGFGGEERFVDGLLSAFAPRRSDAKAFALQYRVLLLQSSSGIGIDVALGGLPFEANLVQRASQFKYEDDCELLTCSAEDLVITKSFANRPQDWIDVEGVVIRQGGRLDRAYVLGELRPLCEAKEDPSILSRIRLLFDKYRS